MLICGHATWRRVHDPIWQGAAASETEGEGGDSAGFGWRRLIYL